MSTASIDGWLSLPISEIANFGSGESISVARLSEQSTASPIPVFGGNGIAGYTSSATVSQPTVILGRVGQKCGIVYRNSGPAWITDNALYVRQYKRPVDVQFLALALEAAHLNDVRNHNDLPLITQSILKDVKIAWPESIEEQGRIAETMSDADKTTAALERTLAKKQAIRQGLVQQLLSGRTRLPGFKESWPSTSLGTLGTFFKGRGVKRDDVRTVGIPCIRYGELYTAFNDYTSEARSFVSWEVAATALPLQSGDLLFTGSGETREEIGKCVAYLGGIPAVAGGDLVILRGSGFNPVYIALLANAPAVVNQKARAGQGDAVVHISSRALAEIRIDLPKKDEQDKIASVILDADRELDSFRHRLDKARAVRQGMMQQLLTGRTRLPIRETAL